MGEITTLDSKITSLAKAKFSHHQQKIMDEVSRQARQNKHVRKVKAVRFKKVVITKKEVLSFDTGEFEIEKGKQDIVVYAEEYINHSNTNDTTTFMYSKEITDEWHWELTAGVTFEYSTEVKLPAAANIKKSITVNLTASGGESHAQSSNYQWNSTIGLEAKKKTTVNALLHQLAGKLPFTCRLHVEGEIKCEADLDIKMAKDRSHEFSIPLSRLLSDNERRYETKGIISGAAGIKANVKKEIEPVSEDSAGQNEIEHNVLYDSDTLTFDFSNLTT